MASQLLRWSPVPTGSLKVLQKPTCSSDFLSLSTCEWRLDRLLNCSAALRLSYQLLFNPDPEEE